MFGGMSNYPPGHPTGISHGESTWIYYCEPCNYSFDKEESQRSERLRPDCAFPTEAFSVCPMCFKQAPRDQCVECGKPATRIDVDRAVNAGESYCDDHGMRF